MDPTAEVARAPASGDPAGPTPSGGVTPPTFAEACRFWLKLGFISFGGPTGQIAILHSELVERRRWIDAPRFLNALNFCLLLPGPEAQQLSIYLGWLLHGTRGGIVAGTLFVLPSAFLLWGLSLLYVHQGQAGWLASAFDGLKPAVVAIVAAAVLRIGRKVLRTRFLGGVALVAFLALALGNVPYPALLGAAALAGVVTSRLRPGWLPAEPEAASGPSAPPGPPPASGSPGWRAFRMAAIGLALWWTPVLLVGAWLGPRHALAQMGVFFSKAAMVTFGGAYAVLPYVAQQAVETHGWLTPGQMLDGLGLAETTPGPLIMVLQFVGFLGGWNQPAPLTPGVAATLGAWITTWTTFVPSFLWVLLGAPHVERLRRLPRWNVAASTLTAAVVGVILNLAMWFGRHVLFPPGQPWNGFGWGVTLAAFVVLTRWRWPVLAVVLLAGGVGTLRGLLG